ncbi:MAG TPA: biotin transporter BioY, partial [Actinomycetota bacterium]|nr:biotin transporter BioY [Actinomycetota bacterium]
ELPAEDPVTALAQTLPRPRGRFAAAAADVALVVAGSLLVAALAQVSIRLPFTPVPITGQTLGVLVVGTSLGWVRGGLALALYLGEIAVGLPFAAEGRSGLEVLTLSTASGGYLWGFVLAATLCGWLANRGWDRSVRSSLGVMLLGNLLVYLVGLPWLMAALDVPALEAFELGLYPFVVGDVLKLLLAAGLLPVAWWLVGRDRG